MCNVSDTESLEGEEWDGISVVVPNYNHGSSLTNTIESLLRQTLPPNEIIIVDDGSNDDSKTVIKQLLQNYETVRLIEHKRNLGAVAAINTGIAASKYRYLAMIAADDRVNAGMLQTLYEALTDAPGAALASGEVEIKVGSGQTSGYRPSVRPCEKIRNFSGKEVANLLVRIDNFILTGATLFVRRLVVDAGQLKEGLGSFADGFLVRELALRYGFVYVPAVLSEWWVSSGGFSRRAVSSTESVKSHIASAVSAFEASRCFPENYARRFEARYSFGALRLAIVENEQGGDVIYGLAPPPRFMRSLFVRLANFGVAGRILALGWATAWYRPLPIFELVGTVLSRRRKQALPNKASQGGSNREHPNSTGKLRIKVTFRRINGTFCTPKVETGYPRESNCNSAEV